MEMNRKLIIVLFLLFTVNIALTYHNTMAVADLQIRMIQVENITDKLVDAVVKMNVAIQAIVDTLDYILEAIRNLVKFQPTGYVTPAPFIPVIGMAIAVKAIGKDEENTDEELENGMEEREPWWARLLGRRTLMAYALVAASIVGFFMELISPDDFVKFGLLVMGYYFGARSTEQGGI